jgi:hypothetical protein
LEDYFKGLIFRLFVDLVIWSTTLQPPSTLFPTFAVSTMKNIDCLAAPTFICFLITNY